MDKKLKVYRSIAQNLYAPFTREDGVSIEELEQAEKSYGFRLPETLREFYLLTGNHHAINASHNRLLSVDCLEIEDNKLLFYEENQCASYWAIDLSDIEKDDPPVWIGQAIVGQEGLEWYLDAENLSDFLLIMLCWQSVMGGLPFTGLVDNIKESVIRTVKNNFSPLKVRGNYSGLQSFIGEGKVLCLAEGEEGASIYVGASDEGKFLEIEDLLQIEWDYCSLDD
jgi:hypothetical protein